MPVMQMKVKKLFQPAQGIQQLKDQRQSRPGGLINICNDICKIRIIGT